MDHEAEEGRGAGDGALSTRGDVSCASRTVGAAKAGKPLVKVVPIDASEVAAPSRIGFMKGQIRVPDDFDTMGDDAVRKLFEGDA